ncbi:MAG: apolipoprotein N-acyltransferase [Pyrinomonadaceae bacterium]
MRETVSTDAGSGARRSRWLSRARTLLPTPAEAFCAAASALLLSCAFPDFDVWPLAWVALVPLLFRLARRPRPVQSLLSGWLAGTLFFYTSCYWLTFPMIHYAGIPAPLSYLLLLVPAAAGGFFPALFALALARLCGRWGTAALLLAPALWVACEWARLGAIGQLWNAVGYSQAFEPALIQSARFGGVYAVSFLVLACNAALAYALLKRSLRGALASLAAVVCVALVVYGATLTDAPGVEHKSSAVVIAVQPNVIPDFNRSESEYEALRRRHFELSDEGLRGLGAPVDERPRVVVWPESPMNFTLERDRRFREELTRYVGERRVSLLFNSLEPAAGGGGYNAAVLVNEKGLPAAQYDKIRLMPFGEYVPLPRWLPGAGMLGGVVGDFTPGEHYTLIPLSSSEGSPRAGAFICLESAYPDITRRLTLEGADVLIEMTNDAYQGNTSVLRQHLSNAVFRAVETGRTLLRVTNTGVSARIDERGRVFEETGRFVEAVRTWPVARSDGSRTFYVEHGDVFAAACSLLSLACIALTFRRKRLEPNF